MLHEVAVGLEVFVLGVHDGLLQDAVIQLAAEVQVVLTQVIVDILGNVQVDQRAVFGLQVLEDSLVAVADDVLYQQALNLAGLFQGGVQAKGLNGFGSLRKPIVESLNQKR